MDQWENLLDKKDGLEYERTMENYRRNMMAANFGGECGELMACCWKSGVKVVVWLTGRYLIYKIEWIKG